MVKKNISFKGSAIKLDCGWVWEFRVAVLGEDPNVDVHSSNEVFATKEQAIRDMKMVIKNATDAVAKKINSPPATEYINLNTNLREKWDVGREH